MVWAAIWHKGEPIYLKSDFIKIWQHGIFFILVTSHGILDEIKRFWAPSHYRWRTLNGFLNSGLNDFLFRTPSEKPAGFHKPLQRRFFRKHLKMLNNIQHWVQTRNSSYWMIPCSQQCRNCAFFLNEEISFLSHYKICSRIWILISFCFLFP